MNMTPVSPDAFGSYVEAQLDRISSERLPGLSIHILKSYSVLGMWYLPIPSSISLNGRQLAVDLLLPHTIPATLSTLLYPLLWGYTFFFGAYALNWLIWGRSFILLHSWGLLHWDGSSSGWGTLANDRGLIERLL